MMLYVDHDTIYRCGGSFVEAAYPTVRPRREEPKNGRLYFWQLFRGMPTANAEGQISSEGSIGKGVPMLPSDSI